jgi:hypothetical protein
MTYVTVRALPNIRVYEGRTSVVSWTTLRTNVRQTALVQIVRPPICDPSDELKAVDGQVPESG